MFSRRRREFLIKMIGSVAAASLWPWLDALAANVDGFSKQKVLSAKTLSDESPLWEKAYSKGLLYGAAASYQHLHDDQDFAAAFARECKVLVPENELKWGNLCKAPGKYDFTKADWLFQFAKEHELYFRGHTLVWHDKLPAWFHSIVNRQNAERIMMEHISKVVPRYKGQTYSWDVVNEAVAPGDGRRDCLRRSAWLNFLGPGYIDSAFRAAAAADPKALLVYNDYEVEFDIHKHDVRREAILALLSQLKSAGTPVHAFGIQGHLRKLPFNPKKFQDFLRSVQQLGLKIMITELDVIDQGLPASLAERDGIVAGMYDEYLTVVLENPAVITVTTWGLSDRYTWLSSWHPRKDGLPVRPLPLDAALNRKPAWKTMANAFDSAPNRH